ncbi:MAG: hypothetical protein Q9214_002426 [Letrouitia sp. 1 TL-2023]
MYRIPKRDMSSDDDSRRLPSLSFQKAVEKFTKTLSAKQKQEFTHSTLEDVYEAIRSIQNRRGSDQTLRNMARVQSFLEAMDQYRKVIEAFLNCTPFLGYVWGPIRFILLLAIKVADTWVNSLDAILDAYEKIEERLPTFMNYTALFEMNPELRRALEFYFCDILEFHTHAMKFLNRPGDFTHSHSGFKVTNNSLDRHKDLIESEKGTLAVLEAQKAREITEAYSKETAEREARDKIKVLIERLNPTDYKRDHFDASEQRRQKRSGEWLYKNSDFCRWHDLDAVCNPLLYIHGVPGAGKTVLSSIVIERLLEDRHGPVLYFYCKYNQPGKNRFNDVLSGLVAQLVQHDNALTDFLHDICSSKDQLGVLGAMEKLAETAFESQAGCYVVIDGLDECQSKEAERIISWLISRNKAIQQADSGRIRLLFVGQRTDILWRMLAPAVAISLDGPEHQADIQDYVKVAAGKVKDEFGMDPCMEAQIVDRVTAAATSMFLFAKLVMENLLNQVTQKDVIRELEPSVFPVDLQGAYHRVCETVFQEGPQRKAVIKIIGTIICTARGLTWREVQAIFYIDPERNTSDYNGCRLRKGCKQLCGSLVDMRRHKDDSENEAVLAIVHETARHYLISKGLISMPLQHLEMAKFCIDYLLSSPLALSASEEEMEYRTKDGYFALHDYASIFFFNHLSYIAKNWAEGNDAVQNDLSVRCQSFVKRYEISGHSRSSDQEDDPINVARFVGSISDNARDRNKCYDIEWRTLRIRRILEVYVETLRPSTGAHDAALDMYGIRVFKCRKVDCRFYFEGFATRSEREAHVDRHDRPYMCDQRSCPFRSLGFESKDQLEKHARNSHVVADDAVCTFPRLHKIRDDSICKAAARGDVTAVKDFLDQGAAVDQTSRSYGGETPLILAAQNSRLNVCKLLLERGADVNFRGPQRSSQTTAIHAAVKSGDIEILQCLLATKDVNPDQTNKYSKTPLTIAAARGPLAMVKLLIDSKRVDVDHLDYSNHCALSLSIWSDDLFDLFMNYTQKETILRILHSHISPRLIKSLLRTGVGEVLLKESDKRGDGLLHAAIKCGEYETVKLLIQLGKFKLDFVDTDGLTPLSNLLFDPPCTGVWDVGKLEDVVKMLIASEKVNLDIIDKEGRTLLSRSAEQGNQNAVNILLATEKVKPDTVDEKGRSPLSRAAERGHLNIVNILLATNNVAVNAMDFEGRTPFSRALQGGNKEIIERFLATGKIDIDTRDNHGKTMLHSALESMRLKEVEWLLRHKDANLNDGNVNEKTWDFFDAAERLHRVGDINDVDLQRLRESGLPPI